MLRAHLLRVAPTPLPTRPCPGASGMAPAVPAARPAAPARPGGTAVPPRRPHPAPAADPVCDVPVGRFFFYMAEAVPLC